MSASIRMVTTSQGDVFKKSVEKMEKTIVAKVGWFGKYPDSKMSVAAVALMQERGVPEKNIPPRPFLEPTVKAKEKSWKSEMVKGANAVTRGAISLGDVMTIIGETAKSDFQRSIARVSNPPLADSTIKARMRRAGMDTSDSSKFGKKYNFKKIKEAAENGGSPILIDKPLIDTGYLFNSIVSILSKE